MKFVTVSTLSPPICHEVMGLDAMILVFWMMSFKLTFSLSSFTFTKRLFSSSSLSDIRVVSSHIWGYWCFSRQSRFQFLLHPAQRFSWWLITALQNTIYFCMLTFISQNPKWNTHRSLSYWPPDPDLGLAWNHLFWAQPCSSLKGFYLNKLRLSKKTALNESILAI